MSLALSTIEELVEILKGEFPDVMQLEDKDCFERGKDAGRIEIIRYIEYKFLEGENNENYR